jgi:hypothetical protein
VKFEVLYNVESVKISLPGRNAVQATKYQYFGVKSSLWNIFLRSETAMLYTCAKSYGVTSL